MFSGPHNFSSIPFSFPRASSAVTSPRFEATFSFICWTVAVDHKFDRFFMILIVNLEKVNSIDIWLSIFTTEISNKDFIRPENRYKNYKKSYNRISILRILLSKADFVTQALSLRISGTYLTRLKLTYFIFFLSS